MKQEFIQPNINFLPVELIRLLTRFQRVIAGRWRKTAYQLKQNLAEPRPIEHKIADEKQYYKPLMQSCSYPLRLLLAEDNIFNQKIVLAMLNKMGCRADVAANGQEVLAALQRQAYDVVLMDVQMPEMDGAEATRLIRQKFPAHKQPRIIAMTANDCAGDREKYLAAGMDDYIRKPVKMEALAQVLGRSWPMKDKTEAAIQIDVHSYSSVINDNAFNELQLIAGHDPEIMGGLIDVFINRATQHVAEIKKSIELEDAARLYQVAHLLKPNAAQFGALTLSNLCNELEIMGRNGHINKDAVNKFSRLEGEFKQVKQALELKMQPRVLDTVC